MTNSAGFKKIPYRLIEQRSETNNLLIVLPGAGYTVQAPLLHFTTSLFYSKGFDVLHINYTLSRQVMSELNDIDFTKDVQQTIENAIKNKNYSNYYVAAKSIGTIVLSGLLHNSLFKNAKAVWLTPLLQREDVFNAMVKSEHKGLCIIGDHDPCFIEKRFEQLKNNDNLTLSLTEGANHALEIDGEPIKSIDILKSVMFEMAEF